MKGRAVARWLDLDVTYRLHVTYGSPIEDATSIQPDFGPSLTQRAEQMQRARVRVIAVQTTIFVVSQILCLVFEPMDAGFNRDALATRPASLGVAVGMAALSMGLAVSLLLLLAGRGLFLDRRMRALVEDETTLAHRRLSTAAGFWAFVLSVLGLYALDFVTPLSLVRSIHLVLIAGVGVPLIRFAFLEWRAADA